MEEESPYFQAPQKENALKINKLHKKSSKEKKIMRFLKENSIEQIVPGEINHIKLKF